MDGVALGGQRAQAHDGRVRVRRLTVHRLSVKDRPYWINFFNFTTVRVINHKLREWRWNARSSLRRIQKRLCLFVDFFRGRATLGALHLVWVEAHRILRRRKEDLPAILVDRNEAARLVLHRLITFRGLNTEDNQCVFDWKALIVTIEHTFKFSVLKRHQDRPNKSRKGAPPVQLVSDLPWLPCLRDRTSRAT